MTCFITDPGMDFSVEIIILDDFLQNQIAESLKQQNTLNHRSFSGSIWFSSIWLFCLYNIKHMGDNCNDIDDVMQ